jgi:hypothetical protein
MNLQAILFADSRTLRSYFLHLELAEYFLLICLYGVIPCLIEQKLSSNSLVLLYVDKGYQCSCKIEACLGRSSQLLNCKRS